MGFAARAPGKLVVLGEYAVLTGADALVMAVDRQCRATVGPALGPRCELETHAPERAEVRFDAGAVSGVALVDHVVATAPAPGAAPWRAVIDSHAFFLGGAKLGLGSSAAALCAFAAAWGAYRAGSSTRGQPTLTALIESHRAFQRGAGSGIDVAAAVTGGVIQFRLDPQLGPRVGSVQLPNSVGFAGVFTGASAKTPDFVEQFEAWRSARQAQSTPLLGALAEVSAAGCSAAREGDARAFLAAIGDYGKLLEDLGRRIGREIVTAEHRKVGALARRFGIAYKTSGAGGGDLGLAFGTDAAALAAFGRAVADAGFAGVGLEIDQDGLIIEEQVG